MSNSYEERAVACFKALASYPALLPDKNKHVASGRGVVWRDRRSGLCLNQNGEHRKKEKSQFFMKVPSVQRAQPALRMHRQGITSFSVLLSWVRIILHVFFHQPDYVLFLLCCQQKPTILQRLKLRIPL